MALLALPPGTRLAGRYRLERRLRSSGAADVWQGTDEALARSVAVRALPTTDPRATRVLEAARAAGRVASPRLASVLDAADADGILVVVSEWLPGTPLRELLHGGPLLPAEAARVLAVVAAALAEAHGVGMAHGALTADSVILTSTGPRLVGFGLDAALAGIDPDPSADVRAVGALLYAALTGRAPSGFPPPAPEAGTVAGWGVDPLPGLAPAPTLAGRGRSPRQVRGGVPAGLDALAERALGRATPSPTAAELAAALVAAGAADGRPGRAITRRVAPLVAVAAALLAGGWAARAPLARLLDSSPSTASLPPPAAGPPAPSPAATPGRTPSAYVPASVRDFDPYGDGSESPETVRFAYDGDRTTAWTTAVYRSRANLGGLKPGVGLLADLGTEQTVRTIDIVLPGDGTDVEVRAGNRAADRADAFDLVASAPGASGSVTLHPTRPRARYWLLWLTRLPAASRGYQGGVSEMAFRP